YIPKRAAGVYIGLARVVAAVPEVQIGHLRAPFAESWRWCEASQRMCRYNFT
ncbi:hypothetical protein B484DRAFT_449874, partial [Ochromonadaceae sp. CCMP2298]